MRPLSTKSLTTSPKLWLTKIHFFCFVLFCSFSVCFFLISVKISNFNWPGLGPASERRSAPTGRNGGRPRRCPSPGQLKFEFFLRRKESCENDRKTIRNGPKRSENDPKRSETVRKRSETVRNGLKTVRNRPKRSENGPKTV